jgi:hypothetical protein
MDPRCAITNYQSAVYLGESSTSALAKQRCSGLRSRWHRVAKGVGGCCNGQARKPPMLVCGGGMTSFNTCTPHHIVASGYSAAAAARGAGASSMAVGTGTSAASTNAAAATISGSFGGSCAASGSSGSASAGVGPASPRSASFASAVTDPSAGVVFEPTSCATGTSTAGSATAAASSVLTGPAASVA